MSVHRVGSARTDPAAGEFIDAVRAWVPRSRVRAACRGPAGCCAQCRRDQAARRVSAFAPRSEVRQDSFPLRPEQIMLAARIHLQPRVRKPLLPPRSVPGAGHRVPCSE
jgi:hypothetical protein